LLLQTRFKRADSFQFRKPMLACLRFLMHQGHGTVRLGKAPVEDPDDDLLLVDRTVAT
jgi:hypothetical protein